MPRRNNKFSLGSVMLLFLLILQPYLSCARKLLCDDHVDVAPKNSCKFDRIYSLGDATADTGNLAAEVPDSLFNKFPYGITLGKPTGRPSNGLLMIDYFASAFGVPYLNPYERGVEKANFDRGANFAVAGATALPIEILQAKGLPPHDETFDGWLATKGLHLRYATNSSLNVQLEWLSSHLNQTCHSREECQDLLKNSLFFIGDIGAKDYSYGFWGLEGAEWDAFAPEVIQNIAQTIRTIIGFGATRVIVPGSLPLGCLPVSLSFFHHEEDSPLFYDSNHCMVGWNNQAARHNQILKAAIEELKKEYPNVLIVYADYYNAYLSVLSNAQNLGFEDKFSACCGSGTVFNFDFGSLCGMPGVNPCPNPDNYISWDGMSLTQQANKYMADYLINSIAPQLKCG
ncbi:OLC1v1037887C1 [Oldenlandia corymbosa var. corymbosa]|uniref:OLC1v1037887C1 n=1 Tax=Oldenlandia corymbosa var. corymbosa TaxID=529605 RepID=A0AAV1CZF6_OLDCO|nr:OLC1v1037887C1 [Oldenlandia corymbosa var. corymbosa]